MSCRFCGGAAHPSTGHQYTPTVLACGPCTREVFAWVRLHTNAVSRRSNRAEAPRPAFYDHARSLTPRYPVVIYSVRRSPLPRPVARSIVFRIGAPREVAVCQAGGPSNITRSFVAVTDQSSQLPRRTSARFHAYDEVG